MRHGCTIVAPAREGSWRPGRPPAICDDSGGRRSGTGVVTQILGDRRPPTVVTVPSLLSGPERARTGRLENMTETFLHFLSDDRGQDLAEYGIALAVIGTLAAAAAIVIAQDVGTLWSRAQSAVDNAVSS